MQLSAKHLTEAIFICLGFIVLYLLIAGSSTLWDRDEPEYARVTCEMVESGNYLVPTFNGQIWPEKPILFYWLMSIPVKLLGPSEIACRLPAIIGTAFTLFLTFYIGSKLFSVKAGLWAQVILATTLMMMFVGSSAIVDGVMLPFIVAAMAVLIRRIGGKIRIPDFLIAGLLMGFGMLAKGPIGLLPVFVMSVILWFGRKGTKEFMVNLAGLALAVIVAVGIFFTWAIPANKAMNGELFRVFFGENVFFRAMKPMESHGGNFFLYLPYYPGIIIAGFFPWIIFLPGAFSAIIGKRICSAAVRNILLSWVAVTVILMTFVATKLPHYIIFTWPSMAVMVAGVITAKKADFNEWDKKWLRGGIWFLMPVGLGLALGLIASGSLLKSEVLEVPGLICGLAILAMTVIWCILQVRERFVENARIIPAGVVVLTVLFLFVLLPAIEDIKISPVIAKAVREKTSKTTPVAVYTYDEPTLNFYIGRKITRLKTEDEIIEWLKSTSERVLIIPKKDLNDIKNKCGDVSFDEIASKKGINYSKGTELEVVALVSRNKTSK